MKHTRIKRLIHAMLSESKDDRGYVDASEVVCKFYERSTSLSEDGESLTYYINFDPEDDIKIFEELYRDGYISSPVWYMKMKVLK